MKEMKVPFLIIVILGMVALNSCSKEGDDSQLEGFFGTAEKSSWDDQYWKEKVKEYQDGRKDTLQARLFIVNYPFDKIRGDNLIILFDDRLVYSQSEGQMRLLDFKDGTEISYNVGVVRGQKIYLGYVKTTFTFESTSIYYYLSFFPDKIDTEESFFIVPSNVEIH